MSLSRCFVFVVASLDSGHLAQPVTDRHERGVTAWKTANHTRVAANIEVQSLNNIVGANARPVFAGKIAVGNAIIHLRGSLF